ncbi:class D sortase [Bacillus sp. PS06]|uniref:class D sortase n=1 Tax=Bacillus sp. PS06 TaxID=2764176 RepID=UPI0017863A1D|nr:class D sortase [Bacillus sp. PS06]MBD8071056.1 class D sortase [Bacillus sp. PS06]
MKKSSIIALLFILCGGGIIGYSGWEIYKTKAETSKSLVEAKELIQQGRENNSQEVIKKSDVKFGETIGILSIPVLNAELPIVEGTDPDDLDKGVGHYRGSYLPDENGQIVLSGHRDTVFRDMGKLKLGDTLVIQLPTGDFTYKITNTKIVSADDTSIITLQDEEEELILTTCYPFSYIGDAPDRYIMYAERQ